MSSKSYSLPQTESPHDVPNPDRDISAFKLPGMGNSNSPDRLNPSEWKSWMFRRVFHSMMLIQGSRATVEGQQRRAHHFTVNYPFGSITTVGEAKQAVDHAVEIVQDHGVTCGMAVLHGHRTTEEAEEQFIAETENNYVTSSGRRFYNWARDQPNWQELLDWKPHVHVIGLAPDVKANEGGANDVLFKRNRTFAPFYLDHPDESVEKEAYRSLNTALFDIYNHPAILPDEQGYITEWFNSDDPAFSHINFPSNPANSQDQEAIRQKYMQYE